MEQANKKIKPCTVKLHRMHLIEDAEIVRERICDQRVRRCHVIVRRLDVNSVHPRISSNQVRRCCVRLPRLNTEVFEALERSSPAVLSERDTDDEAFIADL